MNFYPVYIPTLNRYEHLKRCIDSLRQCTHAEKTELFISLDYPPTEKYREGYEKIKNYLPTITGFAKVNIFYRDHNLGPAQNSIQTQREAFSRYDAAIFTEDDNIFAPSFLDYMNKALDLYASEPRVTSINGYTHAIFNNDTTPISFVHGTCAWGIGMWRHKEEAYQALTSAYYRGIICSRRQSLRLLGASPFIYRMLRDMVRSNASWGDVKRTVCNIMQGTYAIVPHHSLVRNTGYDGSGVNCGESKKNKEFLTQELAQGDTFALSYIKPTNSIPSYIFRSQGYKSGWRGRPRLWKDYVRYAFGILTSPACDTQPR